MTRGRTPCPCCDGAGGGDNDGEGHAYHGGVCGACKGHSLMTKAEALAWTAKHRKYPDTNPDTPITRGG